MQKVLIICGPTATGKTGLALEIAKKYHGELLVADSRQVYKGMDIVTGKDIPDGANFQFPNSNLQKINVGAWETVDGINIWLTDLVSPKRNFSVALWQKRATRVLRVLEKEKSLPIIVGGTGLYIKSLSGDIETLNIRPNKTLRASLAKKTIAELYDILAQMDSVKAASMNNSDRNNPLRLIRAIEIADAGFKSKNKKKQKKYNFLKIGLNISREELFSRIDKRVDLRLENGALEETRGLLSHGLKPTDKSMSVFGYRQLSEFIKGNKTIGEAVNDWKKEEHKYALRQLTWFKKDKEIKWFDISDKDFVSEVEKEVSTWYNS